MALLMDTVAKIDNGYFQCILFSIEDKSMHSYGQKELTPPQQDAIKVSI